jgi:tetratricopeptide (TPR) repeat protein
MLLSREYRLKLLQTDVRKSLVLREIPEVSEVKHQFGKCYVEGMTLTRSESEKLLELIDVSAEPVRDRILLFGYFSAHVYCCKSARKSRQSLILWLVKNLKFSNPTDADFLSNDLELEFISEARTVFCERIKNSSDYIILATYARFLEKIDPDEAQKSYEDALKLKPNNKVIEKLLAALVTNKSELRKAFQLIVSAAPDLQYEKLWADGYTCDGNPESLRKLLGRD